MKKKVLAMVLSAVMVMGMAVTASAADADPGRGTVTGGDGLYYSGETEYSVTSTMSLPVVKITVPTQAPTLIINPFKLDYLTDPADPTTKQSEQVITAPQEIKSASNIPIEISVVDIMATPSSGVILATSEPSDTVKTKSAFLYIEVSTTGDFKEKYIKDDSQYALTSRKSTKSGIATLAAGTDASPAVAKYKIGGKVVASPTTSGWASTDSITVNFKFCFRPVLPASAS